MTKKQNKNINNIENTLELLSEIDIPEEILDAEASLMLNPYVRWAKFILTDDQPNGNRERVPFEEFDNLIRSGIHMPIKMAEGRIEDGHEDASPIGVITHLKKIFVDGINRIEGLAALWLNERPGDVSYLKTKIDNGEPVNLSWEMGASEKVLATDGIYDWKGVALKAATVVGIAAYLGRTQITAMAAKKKTEEKWGQEFIKNLPDSSFLYIERGGSKDLEGRTSPELRHFPVKDDKGLYDESKLREVLVEAGKANLPTPILRSLKQTVTTLLERIAAGASLEEISQVLAAAPLENIILEEETVELEQLKLRVIELEGKLATAEASLKEKDELLTKANDAKAALDTEKVAMTTELDELRIFKKEIDDKAAKAEKLVAIKAKFAEASLVKDETYFIENLEKLLGLDDATLDFMIQELSAFTQNAEASLNGKKVPNLHGEAPVTDIHEIVKALKERKSK